MNVSRLLTARSSLPLRARAARGSVLVFVVILLVLLLGVGMAFVLFVRQEQSATSNALRNVQAEWAAESGLRHALTVLRKSVLAYQTVTPEGLFSLTATTTPYVDTGAGYFRLFEGFDGFDDAAHQPKPGANTTDEEFALLYWRPASDPDLTYNGVDRDREPLHFSEAPLTISTAIDGATRQDLATGPVHAGLARRWELGADLGSFYPVPANAWPKTLPRITGVRGEYYVWVTDLDGKLFVLPDSWGVDHSADARAILEDPAKTSALPLLYNKDHQLLASADLTALLALASWNRFPNLGEFALTLQTQSLSGVLNPANIPGTYTVENYLYARTCLDRYFTPYRDAAVTGGAPPFVKETETALNINTANEETLAAVLGRIPRLEDFTELQRQALAKRICAKRPFLCRMDFEDFLAAHLEQDEDFLAAHLELDATQRLSADANKNTPAGLVYRALDRRVPVTLCQFLELDQLGMTDDSQVLAQCPEYAAVNTPAFMQRRFEFFSATDEHSAAPLYTDETNNALLPPEVFDDLLNSISGKRRPIVNTSTGALTGNLQCRAHGLATGCPVRVITTKNLPGGLLADTLYYARAVDADTLTLHYTAQDAIGTAPPITYTSSDEMVQSILTYGYSYYSFDLVRRQDENGEYQNEAVSLPFAYKFEKFEEEAERPVPAADVDLVKLTPKLEYKFLTQEDLDGTTTGTPLRTYDLTRPKGEPGSLLAWRATNASGYYELGFLPYKDEQLMQYDTRITTTDKDQTVVYIHAAADDTCWTTPGGNDQADDQMVFETLPDPGPCRCESTVHGPVRTYLLYRDPVAGPTSQRASDATDVPDVAWTPRFTFRSRFFVIYVLARTIIGFDGKGQPVYGTKRLEATYDALKDQVLSRRWQATEKRKLGDP